MNGATTATTVRTSSMISQRGCLRLAWAGGASGGPSSRLIACMVVDKQSSAGAQPSFSIAGHPGHAMARTHTRPAPRPAKFSLPRPVGRLPQAARETMVFAVVTLGAAMVLFLWWHDTLAASLNGWGADLTAAGRITGLLGTYLVLVEVVLMGRVRWLDQLIGMDRLAVWHKRNGFYAVWLLIAHALLTIWGYAVSDHATL